MKNIFTSLNVESEKAFGKVLRDYATFDDETFFVDDGYDAIFYSDIDTNEVIDFVVAGASDFSYALSNLSEASKCYQKMVKNADRQYENNELTEDRYHVFTSYDNLTKQSYFHKVRLVFRVSGYVKMDVLYRVDNALRIKDILANTIGALDIYGACTGIILNSNLNEEALTSILKEFTTYYNASCAVIGFFINDRKSIVYPKEETEIDDFITDSNYATRVTWNKTIKDKGHLFVPDTQNSNIPSILSKHWVDKGINSVYYAPVFIGDDAVAYIAVYNIKANLHQSYVIRLISRVMSNTIVNSELQKHNYDLQYRDPLTGFGSLQSFTLTAKDILEEDTGNKYALAFCDIKNFKYVNDMLGYESGDDALRYWTGIFADLTKEKETFCRAMEDSVVVLFRYKDVTDFDEMFLSLPRKLAEFQPFKDRNYKPEVVCGVYLINDNDRLDVNISRWIDWASIAQKNVINKNEKNYIIFNQDMWKAQQREIDIVGSLESSLEKGELKVYYQPQVNYRNKMLVGAECLIRWTHPELGFISPAEFIPICENHGLIPLIDRFVWEEACKTIAFFKQYQDDYHLIPLSVNVSRMDFFIPNLPEVFTNLVKKYDIEPHLLRLEITESAYIKDAELLIKTVEELQAAGFLIEMDDFGSGYSSLNSLKDVPVDVLKLDMLFLGGFRAKSENDKQQIRAEWILNAMLRMAEWIEIPTIAEGVETQDQAELLLELDCELMQGYYFYKPMPYDEFIKIASKK